MPVITFDGHRGVALWTAPRMERDRSGKPVEAAYTDPTYWRTLVRVAEGTTHWYATSTLKAAS